MKYRFASCCLDTDRHVFERDGAALHLEPQVFDLLVLLARSAGELVTHERLVTEVWHGLTVSSVAISARINAARQAVGDDGRAQRIIETVARRGFRMAVPVESEPTVLSGPQEGTAVPSEGLPVLAILPFRCEADRGQDVLVDGIVDEITSALSRVREFEVISRHSGLGSSESRPDIPAAARRLEADYLVEGAVHQAGERLRIRVGLFDAQGRTLWIGRFDETMGDRFDLEDRIAAQVAGQLPVKLREAEILRVGQRARASDGVRSWVLRALPHLWTPQREHNAIAIDYLSRGLALDGGDIRALAYKAWAVAQQPVYMWSDDVGADRAEATRLATRAADRVGDDAPALVAIGAAYSLAVPDLEPARVFVRRSLELDPYNPWGHMRLGWIYVYDHRPTEALEEFERARQLSPHDPFLFNIRVGAAAAQADMGQHELAISMIRDALTNTPGVLWVYRLMASIHGRSGDVANAAACLHELRAVYPTLTMERLLESVPPAVAQRNPRYLEGLRMAGLP